MFIQISMIQDRRDRASQFLHQLKGGWNVNVWMFNKKPQFFPTDLNYTIRERNIIRGVVHNIARGNDVSIMDLLELEQIMHDPKYYEYIIANKLAT